MVVGLHGFEDGMEHFACFAQYCEVGGPDCQFGGSAGLAWVVEIEIRDHFDMTESCIDLGGQSHCSGSKHFGEWESWRAMCHGMQEEVELLPI